MSKPEINPKEPWVWAVYPIVEDDETNEEFFLDLYHYGSEVGGLRVTLEEIAGLRLMLNKALSRGTERKH